MQGCLQGYWSLILRALKGHGNILIQQMSCRDLSLRNFAFRAGEKWYGTSMFAERQVAGLSSWSRVVTLGVRQKHCLRNNWTVHPVGQNTGTEGEWQQRHVSLSAPIK